METGWKSAKEDPKAQDREGRRREAVMGTEEEEQGAGGSLVLLRNLRVQDLTNRAIPKDLA